MACHGVHTLAWFRIPSLASRSRTDSLYFVIVGSILRRRYSVGTGHLYGVEAEGVMRFCAIRKP